MATIRAEQITAEQRQAVEQALQQRTLTPRVRERLEMVKAVALGQDLASVRAWSARAPRTIERWVGRFLTGGVAALADAPRSGRPARADTAYKRQRRNPAVTEIVKIPNRGHSLTIDHGWREVAQTALDFVKRFA